MLVVGETDSEGDPVDCVGRVVVGTLVVGESVGLLVGLRVDGDLDGIRVGTKVGGRVVSTTVRFAQMQNLRPSRYSAAHNTRNPGSGVLTSSARIAYATDQ